MASSEFYIVPTSFVFLKNVPTVFLPAETFSMSDFVPAIFFLRSAMLA